MLRRISVWNCKQSNTLFINSQLDSSIKKNEHCWIMYPTASPQTLPVLFTFTEAIRFNSTVITSQFSSRAEVYYISY